jgi:DNA modification methylase
MTHRILCGDCRKPEDVQRLFAGKKANVVMTSPPYASQRKYDESSGFRPIPPDAYVEWYRAVAEGIESVLAPDGSYFLNIKERAEDGERHLYVKDLTIAHRRQWGWRFVDEFCWRHEGTPGQWSNRFKNQWEPVFHFSRNQVKLNHAAVMHKSPRAGKSLGLDGTTLQGNVGFKGEISKGYAMPGNVIEAYHNEGRDISAIHPAKFPVSLPEFFIKAFSNPGDIIFDPFMGSGTTLIAAAKLGRIGYGMEVSPAYCDVIVKRLMQFDNSQWHLEGCGASFEHVRFGRRLEAEDALKEEALAQPAE